MASDLSDLQERVREHLADLFPVGSAGSLFLGFETFGPAVPPETFRLQPDGEFVPALVLEQLTTVADDVPLVDADEYHRTIRKVASQYKALIDGSATLPGSAEPTVAAFEGAKAEAKRMYENGKVGSFSPVPLPYHPVIGFPANWYDPGATSNWRKVRFTAGTPAPASPPPPPPPPGGVRPWTRFIRPERLTVDAARDRTWKMIVPAENPAAVVPAPATAASHFSLRATATSRPSTAVLAMRRDVVVARAAVAPPAAVATPPARAVSPLVRESVIRIRPELFEVLRTSPPTPPPPTESFEFAFEVQAVQLARPWLHMPFLDTRGWYVPGYRAGEFTSAGLFPAVPIGMVLVRNLTITAKGAVDDRLAKALQFGPFELTEKPAEVRPAGSGRYDIDLSADGVQIIAWVGQVLPQLPPASDPTLAPA